VLFLSLKSGILKFFGLRLDLDFDIFNFLDYGGIGRSFKNTGVDLDHKI